MRHALESTTDWTSGDATTYAGDAGHRHQPSLSVARSKASPQASKEGFSPLIVELSSDAGLHDELQWLSGALQVQDRWILVRSA